MEVQAQLNGIRLAPRKVRAVTDLLKRRDALTALDQLNHLLRRPAPAIAKLIRSALANAQNTYHLVPTNLYIKSIVVNEGLKLKRYMPRAQGRATEIQKKTSGIKVVLDERVPGLRHEHTPASQPATATPEVQEPTARERIDNQSMSGEKKPEIKRELGKKGTFLGNLKRRFFTRKAI